MDAQLTKMFKDCSNALDEKEMYETALPNDVFCSEQYFGMKAEYRHVRAGNNKGKVEIRIVSFKSHISTETGKARAFISKEEFLNRPASGKDKLEAKWAFNLCGVNV